MKKLLILCLLVCSCFSSQGVFAAAVDEPKECPKDLRYALGLYYGNGEQFLLRENNGELELLYRYSQDGYTFAKSNRYPLLKERFDSYTINESGPLTKTEAAVRLERNPDGYAITCKVGGNRYSRSFFPGEGEKAFRFAEPQEPWDTLVKNAAEAEMPDNLTTGKTAVLVNLPDVLAGAHYDLRYATFDNCFGKAITTRPGAYLDAEAAAALARVEAELHTYGYGLLIWEAYRPWSVSKLAYDALPADKKGMLPSPEKGFSHNTGRAVDVSMYYLDTGEPVAMISDFDEPSIRQYSAYAGGTTLQRYQRALLQHSMLREGFQKSAAEWWHFEYGNIAEFAHLNEQL